MKVETVVGSITVALVLCSSALAATNPNQQGLSQAQINQGCVTNGRFVSCPSQMQRTTLKPMGTVPLKPMSTVPLKPMGTVPLKPMSTVPLKPMSTVPLKPMSTVQLKPMGTVQLKPMGAAQLKPTGQVSSTKADQRGKAIDPKGQGLNQAQINAMEGQRQLMWNATGGGMVYR